MHDNFWFIFKTVPDNVAWKTNDIFQPIEVLIDGEG
jgi:hypothetical protein